MTPLPGTRVVPIDWSRNHQPVATGGMNGTCTITDPTRATPGQWDESTGEHGAPTPFVVAADIRCRVQALQGEDTTDQAEQTSRVRRYLVQLDDPHLTTLPDIEVGHVVTVTTAPNDPHLVDLHLTVVDVQHGTERFTRDLVAEHNQQPVTV